MTHVRITLQQVDGSTGLILPRKVLDELRVSIGDTLHLVRTERGYELTAADPLEAEAMAGFDIIRRRHRNAFRDLKE